MICQRTRLWVVLTCVYVAAVFARETPAAEAVAGDTSALHFDFETGDLQGWKVVEGAFDKLISDRAAFHNRYTEDNRYNKQGKFYLSTVEGQDGSSKDHMVGIVESPVFVLSSPGMSFLLGGGNSPSTYLALCTLDGKEVLTARGKNTEVLERVAWKTPELVGQKLFLRIFDGNTDGWGHVTFDDFQATGKLDDAATRDHFVQRKPLLSQELRRLSAQALGAPTIVPANPEMLQILREAIKDLIATFGARYPKGADYLARLDALEKRLAEPQAATDFAALQREALAANPLVSGQPLLYTTHAQYVAIYHAIDTLYQVGEATEGKYHRGGALKVLDVPSGKTKTLVEAPEGLVRSPCVHFDAKKIIFSMRHNPKENFHLFEINVDGTGLKQLTSAPDVSDFDPLYLPDDTVVFSSTREPKYNMCSQDIGANLHRMEADGANIYQITKSTLFENQSSLMPDGRILYKRWEYVDRNFGDAHGFWTVNPDGTNQAVLWGNNKADPGAVYYPRVIPGSGGKLLCILSTHHHNMWGPLAIIDPQLATDGKASILRTWPASVRQRLSDSDRFNCDGMNAINPKYEEPWPLSEKYFLCSRMIGKGPEMGIYLIDTFGNEVLLHAEAPSCFSAMPIVAQARPPLLPSRRTFAQEPGYLYVQNVYQGTHMQGVKPGAVKKIRIVESPEKRAWTSGKWYGQGFQAPGMNWHDFTAKRILGTVPVEADGSAYFTVPSDTFIYFQLLDENGMMIHSMRSGTVLQAGERTGCVGCHEHRLSAPPAVAPASLPAGTETGATPMALRRAASEIEPWYGPPRIFNYLSEVQPVFDKYCVSCHDFGKDGAKKLILAGDKDPFFNASYTQLWRKGYIKPIGAGPSSVQPAYAWGSHASKIVQYLQMNASRVKLDKESFDRLVTWIDLNAPYYPSYDTSYPDNMSGRCPLNDAQMKRLGQLTGIKWDREANFASNTGPWVSFDRPELSPSLEKLAKDGPEYKEALAIIQAGKEVFAKVPRADMPGFQPCEKDASREAFYAKRREIERRNRDAIREGKKMYDGSSQ
ncbi:MAG TPA: hypothetical protein VGP72_26150 [Planctomycetota bacterium]|jgi:hypothetical protein